MEQALLEKSLKAFTEKAWAIVEPKTKLLWGWHHDAICEHLEAVTYQQINRLIINIPPRYMKSLLVAVFWPCWEWTTYPEMKYVFSSYSESLSKRDSLKCRRIITSQWYQERWGNDVLITSDQNEKMRFENTRTGYRLATSVRGLGTGEGGDRIAVDDPHNAMEGESETKRLSCLLWWDETMSTRLNDEIAGAKIIIMQRIHENDLTGHILEKENSDYVHLCLPARYEWGRKKLLTKTPLDFKDPRKKEGDPLWPEKFDKKALDLREKDMTQYAIAGQEQQRPSPRGGGMFKREDIEIVSGFGTVENSVRYWDKAGTDVKANPGSARTAGVLMHKLIDGSFVIADVVKFQKAYGGRNKVIKQTAELDGRPVHIWVEQEPGSGGKESAEISIKDLVGFRVWAERVTGDKETRAEPFAAQVEGKNVKVLKASWTKEFLDELESFPTGKWKDQVDAASGAFNKLAKPRKKAGVWGNKK